MEPNEIRTNHFYLECLGKDAETVEMHEQVTVIRNKVTGNYIVLLTNDDLGPIIVNSDKDEAIRRFIDAFGAMLVHKSLMAAPGIKERFIDSCKEHHTEVFNKFKSQLTNIVSESAEKFTRIKKDLVPA